MYKRALRPDELMHHGIKNQKWGVQNGPPYPLDSSVSTGKKLKTNILSYTDDNTLRKSIHANVWRKRQKYYDMVNNSKMLSKYASIGKEMLEEYKKNKIINNVYQKSIDFTEKRIWTKEYLAQESKEDRQKRRDELLYLMMITADYNR